MVPEKDFVPHSHVPYAEDGSGYYSDNTIGCYRVMLESLPMVLKTIEQSNVPTGSTFTIVDYGTADGGTSMPLMHKSVEALRKQYGEEMPITIIYEDQPINDFKSIFMRLQGLIKGPPSYLKDFKNVFVLASGTNFYSQCVPRNSVHLGFSSTSMHWLSEKPCNITGALHSTMITKVDEKEKFAKQAEKDWERILMKRADELVPGGHLVLIQFAIDEEGQYLGNTKCIKVSMHHKMKSLWQELVQKHVITQEEFNQTTFLNYYRTMIEFKKPFLDPESPVNEKLELVSIETRIVSCPYREKWLKERGNPKEHAAWYIPTLRTWSNSTFMSGLSDSRCRSEKEAIVDQFFQHFQEDVAENPDDHGMDYVHAYITIRKRQ